MGVSIAAGLRGKPQGVTYAVPHRTSHAYPGSDDPCNAAAEDYSSSAGRTTVRVVPWSDGVDHW